MSTSSFVHFDLLSNLKKVWSGCKDKVPTSLRGLSRSQLYLSFLAFIITGSTFFFPFRVFLKDFLQPLISVFTLYLVLELYEANARKEAEAEEKSNRAYFDELNLGWNILSPIYNKNTNELEGFDFKILTEVNASLSEILRFDRFLFSETLKLVKNADQIHRNHPLCPDFMVVHERPEDQAELVNCCANFISSTALKHLEKAKNQLPAGLREKENPIFVVTCENEPIRKHTRLWLMYPSQLLLLKKYKDRINDPRFFRVLRPNWIARIENLIRWAEAEFDENGCRIPREYMSCPVFI